MNLKVVSVIKNQEMLASSHHKERLASSQKTLEKQTIPEFGNPYFNDCPELLILNSRDYAED